MKRELINKLKNFNGFNPNMLYNDLILLEKSSGFDETEFKKFFLAYSLIMTKNISPQKIIEYWNKLDRINPDKIKKLNDSLNERNPDWIGISHPDINSNSQDESEDDEYIKIYLSVDNSSLHKFTNQFLLYSLKYGYNDFDFKINKDSGVNRSDNIVIYCTKKNFEKYINLIQAIIKKNPEISFNQPNLLGIPYDGHIRCGIDPKNAKTSYTYKLCERIFKALQNRMPPEKIADSIDTVNEKGLAHIYGLVHMTSNISMKH